MSERGERGIEHLGSAIWLNLRRMPAYLRLSRGRSLGLSLSLVSLELLSLPVMACFDLWALRYQRQGVPLMLRDFVPMSQAPAQDQETSLRERWRPEQWRGWRQSQGDYLRAALAACKAKDFKALAALTYEQLERALEASARERVALPMTVHLLESIGLFALHALEYREQTNAQSDTFCVAFSRVQVWGLLVASGLDRRAQRMHALGIGVITNDVPPIPFEQAWRALE